MDVQHVAIVGLGSIGCRHLRILKQLRPSVQITIVRSGFGAKFEELDLANRVVSSLEEAVSAGIEAAVISSPAPFHAQQAEFLINAGVHVLVEKPLSDTIEGIEKLLELEKKSNVVCLMGYVMRHERSAQLFKRYLDNDQLGQHLHARIECASYLPSWRPQQPYLESVSASARLGGGVLLELSHELDYIGWLLGEIRTVIGTVNNSGILGIDVEDSADLILDNICGLPISVHLDFNRKNSTRKCCIYAEKGELVWNILRRTVEWNEFECSPIVEFDDSDNESSYLSQLRHFLDCVENNAEPMVTLYDGWKVLKVIESIRISNKIGRKIRVN